MNGKDLTAVCALVLCASPNLSLSTCPAIQLSADFQQVILFTGALLLASKIQSTQKAESLYISAVDGY